MSFIENVKKKAKENKKVIVLPESSDERTIKATETILKEGFADIILVGDENEVKNKFKSYDLSRAKFISQEDENLVSEFCELFIKLREKKGMTKELALKLLKDPLYFGVALVKSGRADGMVAGAINSTADVLRASLQIVGTASGFKIVSSFFVMIVPDCEFGENGTFLFSDCAICPSPTSEELAQIAIASARNFKSLIGKEPFVGLLSHSTYGSSEHNDAKKIVEAAKIAKDLAPDIAIDGELQLDAAIVPSIGASKAKGSNVAGKANVLVFPDLDSGNIGYKLVQRLAKAEAYGPISQGMAAPINDLSRGCSAEDIVGVVAITALQAQG